MQTEDPDKRRGVVLNLFWLGFIIYSASYTISSTDQVNYIVCNVFQVIGMMLFIPSAAVLIHLRIENSYLKVVYFLYCIWLISILFRGIEFDYISVKTLLFDPNFGMFIYFVPFVLLMPVTPGFIKKLFDVIVILGIVYIIYNLIFIKQVLYPYYNVRSQAIMEFFTQQLSLPVGFLLLTFIYHSKKKNLFALFLVGATFILSVIRARRGLMFMSFSMLLFTYLVYQFVSKTKIVNVILSFFFIIIIVFGAVRIYESNRTDTFGLITKRIGEKTRTSVEAYFVRDFDGNDWIIGRGVNGVYFCPGVMDEENKLSIYRKVIETGYLQIILKGGIISLILFLLIAIPAIILGVFRSANILSKAAGIWIFLFLLFMYPGSLAIFSLHYMLVWISIGICYSDKIRSMSDDEFKEVLTPGSIN
jgi:hypothetical protein